MGLVLCNRYPTTIETSIMFYSPESCGGEGGNFEKMGWWRIAPGSCALVYANDLDNRFWYYFAEADDGAVWSGPFLASVSLSRFGGRRWCWGLETSDPAQIRIGYRELDIGDNNNYTLNFVP
jgi:uncharacterized membrane protein